jgi:hypothetical protein
LLKGASGKDLFNFIQEIYSKKGIWFYHILPAECHFEFLGFVVSLGVCRQVKQPANSGLAVKSLIGNSGLESVG